MHATNPPFVFRCFCCQRNIVRQPSANTPTRVYMSNKEIEGTFSHCRRVRGLERVVNHSFGMQTSSAWWNKTREMYSSGENRAVFWISFALFAI